MEKQKIKDFFNYFASLSFAENIKMAKENIALKKKIRSLDSELGELREDESEIISRSLEQEREYLRSLEQEREYLRSLEQEREYQKLMRIKLYYD